MSENEPPEGPGELPDEAEWTDSLESVPPATPTPPPLRSPLTGAPPGAPRPPPPPPPPPPPQGRRTGRRAAPRRTRRATRRSFDFGGVLGSLFKVYGRMWLSIALLSAILIAPGSLALLKVKSDMLEASQRDRHAEQTVDDVIQPAVMMMGVGAFQVFMQMVLAGAITYLVVRHQQGRPVGVGEALARGLSRFFPIVGTMLLNLLVIGGMFLPAIFLGAVADSVGLAVLFIFLAIVPASMYWYSVFVCAPACAVEQLGPVASIKRSRMLCKGFRWYLLLLHLVMFLIGIAIAMVVQIPFLASQAASGYFAYSMGHQLATTVTEILVGTPLGALLLAMSYVELRSVKEGVDPEGIVGVFD